MCKKLKTTITLAPHIKEFASKEAKSLGLDFSAYITVLIGEKMRGTMIPSTIKKVSDDKIDEAAISIDEKESIKIDSEQENEIDRLLQW
ncbi:MULTISPECIES: hypothetical protein [Clostridium]|jgi:hypothetical protein|uniref:Propanediol utilization protein n=5 Tax=Clostridium TaxID=1485 RepID=A0A0B5QYP1_CLOBE|nr:MULTISPECIES: hypothetical protein [Clostridium]ABR37120.1 hypothetical protein Cbei_5014 [Clostridium beijerinckii NCIMB 8052]AIU05213.1 hypothetical protein Cbs_5014 [Clostridium beijerinckii ATCC 35702]AJH02139.1 hypothetical protein LF65_05632 [Clostridium beijerinckii]ALB43882.1 hypothetical protein X276_00565 [Clostridium beijerinckii NRRL B-598]AQS07864.1 hypothetical protein CLBIJ_53350 [Clostridium beijerinckii]